MGAFWGRFLHGGSNDFIRVVFGLDVDYDVRVKSTGKIWLSGAVTLVLAAVVQAEVTDLKDHPYQVIIDRNPFGLQDVPPPPDPTLTNPPPVKVDVKFTGITSDGGTKRAWLMIPTGPGRAQPKYFSAAEGGGEDDITVVEINESETTVKILNAGVPVVLNFKDHGLAAPAAPIVPVTQPGGALRPGMVPAPAVVPAPVTPTPGIRTASGAPYVPQTSATPGMMTQPSINPALRQIPSRNLRTTPVEPQQQIDPAVQYLQMKLQEQKARSEGVHFPPVPSLPGAPSP
jgi:hypothetical protein